MATVTKKTVAPFYAVGAVWLAWSIFFPLYRVSDYLLCAGVSCVLAFLASRIWPSKTWTAAGPAQPEQPKAESKPQSTGNPEIDALIAERDKAVSEMKRLNDAIKDEKISAQIDRLEAATKKIIGVVVEKPEKLPQIRKFMNYFLPTTLKLLNAYDRMDSTGIDGENITATKEKVVKMLDTLCAAFDKQLDSLYGDEALDISTDITVMEQMLQQEGLGGTGTGGAGGTKLEL